MQEGLQQGLVQGRTETLLRLLNQRFGPVPAAIEARLRCATGADLARRIDRVLDATTLDALFAGE